MKKLRLQSGDATRMSKALLRFYLFPLLFQMVIYSPFDHFLVITCHSNAAIWYFHSNSLLFFSFILYPFEWIVVDFLFSFTSLTYYSFLKHSCFCKVKFWLQFSSISKTMNLENLRKLSCECLKIIRLFRIDQILFFMLRTSTTNLIQFGFFRIHWSPFILMQPFGICDPVNLRFISFYRILFYKYFLPLLLIFRSSEGVNDSSIQASNFDIIQRSRLIKRLRTVCREAKESFIQNRVI